MVTTTFANGQFRKGDSFDFDRAVALINNASVCVIMHVSILFQLLFLFTTGCFVTREKRIGLCTTTMQSGND
jgi:hypothetical protein